MNFADIERLAAQGESETVEFKASTGQLPRAGKALCGFLNHRGGLLIFGVGPGGEITGQIVSDKTLQDIAGMLRSFEPQPSVSVERIALPESTRHVIVLEAQTRADLIPFVFEGRAYERLGTTVSPMPQPRYQEMLLNRMHTQHRWENQRAEGYRVQDLDENEILRTARLGISSGRMPESSGERPAEILQRLGLQVNGSILNAAVVTFGRRLLPEFPQCQLRMARFKGTDKTEFLDHRQAQGHAFQLLEEALLFLRRHLPVAGRVQPSAVGVRFLPVGYIAPLRVSHDLTPRQREILFLLSGRGPTPLRDIRGGLENPPAHRTLQDDLAHLKRLGLIDSGGHGRAAAYWLCRAK